MIGELWAEFFRCCILTSFGDGVVAMSSALFGSGRTAVGNTAVPFNSAVDWLLSTWGVALALGFVVYTVGRVTGAHLNSAITFGAAIRRQLPLNKVLTHGISLVLGCFVGTELVILVYNDAINHYDQVN